MSVSLSLIKDLREKTGAGMSDCKKALEESAGDIAKAIEYLRKKGAAMAAKRADKIAKEGAIKSAIHGDKSSAVIVEVNCETDFVSKGDDFQNFVQGIADIALENGTEDVAHLLTCKGKDGLTVQDTIDAMMGKVGEKIEFKRVKLVKIEGGFVANYIHFGSKIGGLVGMKGKYNEEVYDLGKKLAMQVVAMNPVSISREGVSAETIEKEREIYYVQARNDKKPENIIDKIVQNKVEKYFQENCLLEQEFIQEAHKTVGDLLKDYTKKSGEHVEVTDMVRFQLG
ncbi:elongation factor Ts [bacterium]|nr:MAG: elongation factor Ts [bacterium]